MTLSEKIIHKTIQYKPFLQTISIIVLLLLSAYFLLPNTIFKPILPGLDPSWQISLHLAIKNKMVFGQDFIFTYGPLGYIITRLPVGVSKWAIFALDMLLIANLLFAITVILSKNFLKKLFLKVLILGVFTIYILGDFYTYDLVMVWFWAYLFMVFYFLKTSKTWILANFQVLSIILFYMKLNAGVIAVFVLVLTYFYTIFFSDFPKKKLGISFFIYALMFYLSTFLFNISLLDYALGGLQTINAYNDAMFANANMKEAQNWLVFFPTMAFLGIFICSVLYILGEKKEGKYLDKKYLYFNLFLSMVVSGALYILFKQSFVRADEVHIFTFLQFAPSFASLIAIFGSQKTQKYAIFVLSFLLILSFQTRFQHINWTDKTKNTTKYVSDMLNNDYKADTSWFYASRKLNTTFLKENIGKKTVDIMPWEVSYLLCNNLNYNPRPTIQSYTSYNSYLDKKNYDKYLSSTAPEKVIFALNSIDARYAFWDEAQTKIALLENYNITFPKDTLFDAQFYKKQYADSLKSISKENLYNHFLTEGIKNNKIGNFYDFYFDEGFYKFFNPSVSQGIIDKKSKNAFDYYKNIGFFEGQKTGETSIIFTKKEKTKKAAAKIINTKNAKMGEWITIPMSEKPIYAYTDINYNLEGKIIRFLYQPAYLSVSLKFENGQVNTFKCVLPIINGGVLINKKVLSDADAYVFFKSFGLLNQKIVAFKIDGTDLEEEFNEEFYVSYHKDVANAIKEKTFSSGFEHYTQYGKNEKRKAIENRIYKGFKNDFSVIFKEISQ